MTRLEQMLAPEKAATRAVPRHCPSCEDRAPARLLGEQDSFPWYLCGRCGCRFVGRSPSQAEIDAVYATYYSGGMQIPQFVRERLREIVRSFEPFRSTGRLLDVGYGAGTLLSVAEEEGWDCWGTEVSQDALQLGRQRGWQVVDGDFCVAALPEDWFDVVCMVEVLEHLRSPLDYMRQAMRVLRPGGLFYATTPHGASLNSRLLGVRWSIYSAPEHLQLFNAASTRGALERSGFVRIAIRTEGLNPTEILNRVTRREPTMTRNEAAYALNERLSSGKIRPLLKRQLNTALSLTRWGDTLKIRGEKPVR